MDGTSLREPPALALYEVAKSLSKGNVVVVERLYENHPLYEVAKNLSKGDVVVVERLYENHPLYDVAKSLSKGNVVVLEGFDEDSVIDIIELEKCD
jgi:hypothetical protein